ncbi:MAG: hypothetical protein V1844_09765 [Pseudomonadota bacterium]
MEKITKRKISKAAGIVPGFLSDILNHGKRPSWKTAKRLASGTNSTPEQWLEAPPETLRQIISEYIQQERPAS